MTAAVFRQSYMTQRPSLLTLISYCAIVFSFALIFANGWFAACDGFCGALACWLSHMKHYHYQTITITVKCHKGRNKAKKILNTKIPTNPYKIATFSVGIPYSLQKPKNPYCKDFSLCAATLTRLVTDPILSEVARVTFSDSDSAPVPKFLNPGPAIFQIWESDSCSDSGYNHQSNLNLPMFKMTTQTPASAEIEKWLRIRVRLFPNFLLRVWIRFEGKTQNPTGVNSGCPDPVPSLDHGSGFWRQIWRQLIAL